jgi:hypothetical protein
MDKETVVAKVAELTTWWIEQRATKIKQVEHGSMEVNPFLAPLICALHGLKDARELATFVTAGHFYIGHGTGFGKLIDEKVLPQAFGTAKLDKAYRAANGLTDPAFDDIDQIVTKSDGVYLLSQKASKWTIQLGQAMGLNRSFKTLLDFRANGVIDFKKIVVGVFYGSDDLLTDKYRILRGITTGAAHDVVDISNDVEVYAGRSFWTWLAGDARAQEWVIAGIFQAIQSAVEDEKEAQKASDEIEGELTGMLSQVGDIKTEQDWIKFINAVNY